MSTEEDEIQITSETITTTSSSGDATEPLLLKAERDATSHGGEFNGASFTGAVFNLSTAIIGAGIMALPSTMKFLGLILGIVMIIAMAFLTDKSIEFLLRFSHIGNQRSYGGLMNDSYGKYGKILLQFSICLSNIGVLIVYMIIIGDVLAGKDENGIHYVGLLEEWFGEYWLITRVYVLLITTLCVFFPLTCFKNIDSLRYTSALSVVLAFIFLLIISGITILKFFNGGLMMPRLLPNVADWPSFSRLFTVVPVLVNAYICHSNVHNIQNELRDPTEIKPAVRLALGICSSVYVLTSLSGYLLFGESTVDDVLANFDTDLGIPFSAVLNDAVRVSYVAHLMLVFPIIFYPLRVNFDDLWFPGAASNLRFFSITIGFIALIFMLANFIPNIWDAFQVTGATASVCIGFIFPASVVLRNHHNQATNRDKIIAGSMVVLAVVSSVVAIASVILSFLKGGNTSRFQFLN